MKLGFVSAILPEYNLAEVLLAAKSIGYQCVEAMCWPLGKAERRYAGVTHIDVENLDEQEIQRIKELESETNISISALGYYPNPLAPDSKEAEKYVDHIRKVISAAPKLGLDNINTFIGRNWQQSIDENWPQFLSTWKPLIEHAEAHGVKIGIENCPMLFTKDEWPGGKNLATSPVIWERMFNDIPSDYFGLNFDPSHFIWQQMDYVKAIEKFGSKFFHTHAKDVKMDAELDEVGILAYPLEYHTPKLPGLGDVDWTLFFGSLKKIGYTGPVCVEVEDSDFESTQELRKLSLQKSYEYLKPFFGNEND